MWVGLSNLGFKIKEHVLQDPIYTLMEHGVAGKSVDLAELLLVIFP